jgi:5-methylcytosine-specific restriction enzyme A
MACRPQVDRPAVGCRVEFPLRRTVLLSSFSRDRRPEQYGYRDGWSEDVVFLYTGRDYTGRDRVVTWILPGGMLLCAITRRTQKSFRLVGSLGRGQGYQYEWKFSCASCEYRRGTDGDGVLRRTIGV